MISSRFVYHSNPIRIAVFAVATALLAGPVTALAATPDRAAIAREVANRHDAAVKRLRDWIALPSIAAEGERKSVLLRKRVSESVDTRRRPHIKKNTTQINT